LKKDMPLLKIGERVIDIEIGAKEEFASSRI
jgi:hypothetical protein